MIALGIAAAGILAEAWVAPLQTNQPVDSLSGVHAAAAAGVRQPAATPIYREIKALPDPVVLAELPFGEPAYDVLAVFYAGHHRRPLLNGYSGFFPQSYLERAPILRACPTPASGPRESCATPTPRTSSSTRPHSPATAARRSASGCSRSVRGKLRRTDRIGCSRCSEGGCRRRRSARCRLSQPPGTR